MSIVKIAVVVIATLLGVGFIVWCIVGVWVEVQIGKARKAEQERELTRRKRIAQGNDSIRDTYTWGARPAKTDGEKG
jgi:hypothetical protein